MARYLLTHPVIAGALYGVTLAVAGLLFVGGQLVVAQTLLAALAFTVAEVARADGWAMGHEAGLREGRALAAGVRIAKARSSG